MSNYIKLIANIQRNIVRLATELKASGNEDLAILLSLCAAKLDDDGDKTVIKSWINIICDEAEKRPRMSLCPQCKTVKKEFEECSRCKKPVQSELKIEAPK